MYTGLLSLIHLNYSIKSSLWKNNGLHLLFSFLISFIRNKTLQRVSGLDTGQSIDRVSVGVIHHHEYLFVWKDQQWCQHSHMIYWSGGQLFKKAHQLISDIHQQPSRGPGAFWPCWSRLKACRGLCDISGVLTCRTHCQNLRTVGELHVCSFWLICTLSEWRLLMFTWTQ